MNVSASTNNPTGQLQADGYLKLPKLFEPAEVAAMLKCLENATAGAPDARRSREVFAIRNVLGEVPDLLPLLHTPALCKLLGQLFPEGCHSVKSIYFDKPALSNWFVPWHQDLMINVDRRTDLAGFGPWTSKAEGVSVQPPLAILQNSCTIRIHLDDCDASNGALHVVPGSHQLGVVLSAALPGLTQNSVVCEVPAGGVMLMRPLLLHASNRSTSNRPRRVLHLEFSASELPVGLHWRERRFARW